MSTFSTIFKKKFFLMYLDTSGQFQAINLVFASEHYIRESYKQRYFHFPDGFCSLPKLCVLDNNLVSYFNK